MIVIFVMSSLEHTGVLQWLSSVSQMASTNDIISIPAEQPCGLTLAYHLGGGGCVTSCSAPNVSGKGRRQVGPSFADEVGGMRRGLPPSTESIFSTAVMLCSGRGF